MDWTNILATDAERSFLLAMLEVPADPTPRLVFADWLEERGDRRGELVRLQEQLRAWGANIPPERAATERRVHALLQERTKPIGPYWSNSINMEMAFVFPGEFLMGSPPDEEFRGETEVQAKTSLTGGFWIGKCCVTQCQWRALTSCQPWDNDVWVRQGRSYPATFVDYERATDFCLKLTRQEQQTGMLSKNWEYRLPTEAEWEFACRAGTTTAYSFGDSSQPDHGWFKENARHRNQEFAHKVGMKSPNALNLFDMHGNVWELCLDGYSDVLPGGKDPVVNVREWQAHVARGGSWFSAVTMARSASRSATPDLVRSASIGFRVALTPT